ncbi:MAG: hypothetical protein P8179_03015 [Candidatus Thiodiazotropha sp.]
MKGALVAVQGKTQRRRIARYSKELQRCHVLPQACHSRCSVVHPVGDHNHRSYFFKIRNLLLEWSGQLIFLGLMMPMGVRHHRMKRQSMRVTTTHFS